MEWLKTICNPDGREICTKPWTVHIDGRTLTVATNSYYLVAVDGNFGTPPDPKGKIAKSVLDILQTQGMEFIGGSTAADLEAWAGPYEGPQEVECPQCIGDGLCNRCDCEASHKCGVCDGSGQVTECLDPRYGTVGEVLVNRNLIAATAPHLAGGCNVEVKGKDLVRFVGANWIMLVIGSKADNPDRGPALQLDMAALAAPAVA